MPTFPKLQPTFTLIEKKDGSLFSKGSKSKALANMSNIFISAPLTNGKSPDQDTAWHSNYC